MDENYSGRDTTTGTDFESRPDKPNWRSKEAPEGKFDDLDPKPREYKAREPKPRGEFSERKSSRFESREKGDFETRKPRRDSDSNESEYKSREFKPREFKPREKSNDSGFVPREKKEFSKDFRKNEAPVRDSRPGREERTDRRKVEKVKLKPATRIEDLSEYLQAKKNTPEIPDTVLNTSSAETQTPDTTKREPSKGNKFTEKRDYQVVRTRELRPRKAKNTDDSHAKPISKPDSKVAKPTINYDDLED
jgi:hypothetical protein